MPSFLARHATPFITGLFLVSLVSGLALFLHTGLQAMHPIHEWLSLLLILPVGLHIWKNWRPMTAYFRHWPMAVALGLSALAAAPFFLLSGEGRGGPPQMALARTVFAAPAATVAPLLSTTGPELLARLAAAGFAVADPAAPLSEIAARSGRSEAELAAALVGRGS